MINEIHTYFDYSHNRQNENKITFAISRNKLKELSAKDLMIYATICRFINSDNTGIFDDRYISEVLHIDKRTARKYIDSLTTKNIVMEIRTTIGNVSIFRISDSDFDNFHSDLVFIPKSVIDAKNLNVLEKYILVNVFEYIRRTNENEFRIQDIVKIRNRIKGHRQLVYRYIKKLITTGLIKLIDGYKNSIRNRWFKLDFNAVYNIETNKLGCYTNWYKRKIGEHKFMNLIKNEGYTINIGKLDSNRTNMFDTIKTWMAFQKRIILDGLWYVEDFNNTYMAMDTRLMCDFINTYPDRYKKIFLKNQPCKIDTYFGNKVIRVIPSVYNVNNNVNSNNNSNNNNHNKGMGYIRKNGNDNDNSNNNAMHNISNNVMANNNGNNKDNKKYKYLKIYYNKYLNIKRLDGVKPRTNEHDDIIWKTEGGRTCKNALEKPPAVMSVETEQDKEYARETGVFGGFEYIKHVHYNEIFLDGVINKLRRKGIYIDQIGGIGGNWTYRAERDIGARADDGRYIKMIKRLYKISRSRRYWAYGLVKISKKMKRRIGKVYINCWRHNSCSEAHCLMWNRFFKNNFKIGDLNYLRYLLDYTERVREFMSKSKIYGNRYDWYVDTKFYTKRYYEIRRKVKELYNAPRVVRRGRKYIWRIKKARASGMYFRGRRHIAKLREMAIEKGAERIRNGYIPIKFLQAYINGGIDYRDKVVDIIYGRKIRQADRGTFRYGLELLIKEMKDLGELSELYKDEILRVDRIWQASEIDQWIAERGKQ